MVFCQDGPVLRDYEPGAQPLRRLRGCCSFKARPLPDFSVVTSIKTPLGETVSTKSAYPPAGTAKATDVPSRVVIATQARAVRVVDRGNVIWVYLGLKSARQVAALSEALEQLTNGNLSTRVAAPVGWSGDLTLIRHKIDRMARAQESSVAALRQGSSDIAHDLKTPIQRVSVYLDELALRANLRGQPEKLVSEARAELDNIASISNRADRNWIAEIAFYQGRPWYTCANTWRTL